MGGVHGTQEGADLKKAWGEPNALCYNTKIFMEIPHDNDGMDFKGVSRLPMAERLDACPPFVQGIVKQAQDILGIEKAWSFGSRARGDARPGSDYDLAFLPSADKRDQWPYFFTLVHNEPFTLHQLDLVEYGSADQELKDKILKDGILIYERSR